MFLFAFELWLGLGTRKMRKPEVVIGSSPTLFAAFAFLRRRAGDSCGCCGDVEVMVHLNSEITGAFPMPGDT
jgi:hypothetical protein